ncbi:hypothetical protein ACFQS7_13580 [Dankookia sp. GCM10030260]|uniref:hypothetical protein n=1 Tax=Dankookia sp. GCM10030260 TaxID=3273390 RepID=UPI0036127342
MNQAQESLLGPAGAARSTWALIYNHGPWPLHLLGASFESGGFAAGGDPSAVIEPKTVGGCRVESRGQASGVAGAVVQYGWRPTGQVPLPLAGHLQPLRRQQ